MLLYEQLLIFLSRWLGVLVLQQPAVPLNLVISLALLLVLLLVLVMLLSLLLLSFVLLLSLLLRQQQLLLLALELFEARVKCRQRRQHTVRAPHERVLRARLHGGKGPPAGPFPSGALGPSLEPS